MDPKVLAGRRKIQPVESRRVVVPDYWLSFDVGGVPFLEPCFASILKMDRSRFRDKNYALFVHDHCRYGQEFKWDEKQPEKSYPPPLQGVAHKITLRDWEVLIQSETGWGHDVPTGYDQIQVQCIVVGDDDDEHSISAHVLATRPLSIKSQCQPSPGYKNLLITGAAHHNLDPAYQDYLAHIVPYECTGAPSFLARRVFQVFNLPLLLAFKLLVRHNKGKPANQHSQPPYWIAWCFDKASRFSNAAHDYLIVPILASGRCSTIGNQVYTRKRIEAELARVKKEDYSPRTYR
ncbi:hypothetical protein BGX26_001736 [Mortierella sp. AD094]|nr:hypothetical protein BGX26_001736 [Mortierella sp. AD094]